MTRQTAIQRLFVTWCIGGFSLLFLVGLQVIGGKYGNDDIAAWTWLLGIVVAPLSLLGTAAFVDSSATWRNAAANGFKYKMALGFSVLMILLALATLAGEPLVSMSSYDLFTGTGVPISILQGFLMAAVGAVVFDRR